MAIAQRLALGTAQFGLAYGVANRRGQVDRGAAARMVALARARGVDTIDTAIAYGESEACLGAIGVGDLRVVTKLPAIPAGVRDVEGWVRDALAASRARLGVARLYAVLLHRPAELLGVHGAALCRALRASKDDGTAARIGCSIYGPSELDALVAARVEMDVVQAPFNVVDRRLVASGWLRRLKDAGVEVHTRSAFLQGLLLMDRRAVPPAFERWSGIWDAWSYYLASSGRSALEASLSFVLRQGAIDRVVVGADGLDQLGEIIDAASADASPVPDAVASEDEALVDPSRWPR